MRTIKRIVPTRQWTLEVTFESGETRVFDTKPLLLLEAFEDLRDIERFLMVRNRGYFIEWDGEIDLSADTLFHDGVSKTSSLSSADS